MKECSNTRELPKCCESSSLLPSEEGLLHNLSDLLLLLLIFLVILFHDDRVDEGAIEHEFGRTAKTLSDGKFSSGSRHRSLLRDLSGRMTYVADYLWRVKRT